MKHDYYLEMTEKGLTLRDRHSPHQLRIDFLSEKSVSRAKKASRKSELLLRACGTTSGTHPTIFDVTAGLGRDAYLLTKAGAQVTCIERSPMMFALLQDAIERAKIEIKLIQQDAITYLKSLPTSECPDMIYMDPMFPSRKKAALNKIEMRILAELVGQDVDANHLCAIACQKALKRVIVKRPIYAAPLKDKPDFAIKGKTNRFDVYLTNNLSDG